jgi:hypothetical protein
MSDNIETFLDLALSGRALLLEIDDYVDAWHEDGHGVPLHAYLGLSAEEYSLWMSEPDMLAHIVRARRDHIQLGELVASVVNDNDMSRDERIAARASDIGNIDRLKRWLHTEGIDFI